MKKRNVFFTITAIIFLGVLAFIITNSNSNTENIYKINKYLPSEELEGRLTGTKGNEKAQNFIKSYYKDLKLETFQGISYLHPYNHIFTDFDNSQIELSITTSDGNTKCFEYGIDFMPRSFSKTLDISCKISETPDRNCFLLLDKHEMKQDYLKTKGILVKCDDFMKTISIGNGLPIIQINKKTYDYINNNIGCTISVKYNLIQKNITANNVVAKISGTNSNNAIILSAHFDHVGKTGDTIYAGALDNSSGTSILLDLAKKLKNYSKNHELGQDILFCSFNGEESGRQGSKVFVKQLIDLNAYKNVYNINLDCIGYTNTYEINDDNFDNSINSPNSLNNEICKFLLNNDINCIQQFGASSDHVSFFNENISAICISNSRIDILHTKHDTLDKLNINYMKYFSDQLFSFIILNSDKTYEPEEIELDTTFDVNDEDKYIELSKNLNINEYKYIENDDGIFQKIMRTNIIYDNIYDFKKVFNSSTLPKKIDNYILNKIELTCTDFPDTQIGEIDKVYTYNDFGIKNINTINLTFKHAEDTDKCLKIKLFTNRNKNTKVEDMYVENNINLIKINDDNQSYYIDYDNDAKYFGEITAIISKDDLSYSIRVNKFKTKNMEIEGKEQEVNVIDWFDYSLEATKEFMRKIRFENIVDDLIK